MSELAVPLTSKRREFGALLQKLQHVVPSLPLLFHGIERVGHDGHGWSRALGVAEIVTSVLVVGAFARQVRATRSGHVDPGAETHHHVDWVDLFLAAMLAVEVWAHWHETGHIKRPTVLVAITMLVLGLFHGRIVGAGNRRRGVWVTDDGIHVSRRPFSHFRATWADLAAIDLGPRQARVVRRDGELYVLDLGDLRNAAEVREVLEAARLRLPAAEQDAGPTPPRA